MLSNKLGENRKSDKTSLTVILFMQSNHQRTVILKVRWETEYLHNPKLFTMSYLLIAKQEIVLHRRELGKLFYSK